MQKSESLCENLGACAEILVLVRKSGWACAAIRGLVRKSEALCGNPEGLCGNLEELVRKSEMLIREMCFGGPVAPLSAKHSLKTNSNASGTVGRQNNAYFPNVRAFLIVVRICAVLGCA